MSMKRTEGGFRVTEDHGRPSNPLSGIVDKIDNGIKSFFRKEDNRQPHEILAQLKASAEELPETDKDRGYMLLLIARVERQAEHLIDDVNVMEDYFDSKEDVEAVRELVRRLISDFNMG
jgi:hypothetical protein